MSGGTTGPGEETSFAPCTILQLPDDRLIEAADRAIAINPANAPDTRMLRRAYPHAAMNRLHLALLTARRWPESGVTLTVGFLDKPDAGELAKIVYYMNLWNNTANVRFVATNGTGQVRISRVAGNGNYSVIGTDILLPEYNGKATMNLDYSWITSEADLKKYVCHETGHTLGFPHEHLRPEIVDRIDEDKAIAYYKKCCNWEEWQVWENVLTPLVTSAFIASASPDPRSIMCYNLPAEIMKDGKGVPGGTEIDETDGIFAASVYPRRAESVVAAIGGGQDQRVFYRAKPAPGTERLDGDIHELSCAGDRWSHRDATADVGGVAAIAGSAIAALRGAPYDDRIYYLSADLHVQEVAWLLGSKPYDSGFGWHRDLTDIADGAAAVTGSPIAAIRGMSMPRVYHLGAGGHVHELANSVSASWSHCDVTAAAGAVAAVANSPLAAVLGAGMNPRVYYVSADGHVRELAWLGSDWSHRDVTADAGAVTAMAGSPLAAVQVEHGLYSWEPHVYYLTADGHVHELAWSGSAWSHRDVTADSGAVAAMEKSPIAAMCQGYASEPRIYYLTADGHVHELGWSGKWSHRDVTADAGAVAAVTGGGLTAIGIGEYAAPRVYYLSADRLVRELAWVGHWAGGPAIGA